jgi:putative oxidoreductase
MNNLLPYTSGTHDILILFLRLMVGSFLIYHGIEVFDSAKMDGYAGWMPRFRLLSPSQIAYAGKAAELVTGILLTLGLFVRPASAAIIAVFLFITFRLGEGRIYMEEQHPFMFVLFGILFLVAGGGKWSIDKYLQKPSA